MSLAQAITRAKGGDWSGNRGLIPGIGHTSSDRSLSICDSADGRDVILHSFAGDDWQAAKDALRAEGLLPASSHHLATLEPVGGADRVFTYLNTNGAPQFRIVRKTGKRFVAEHLDDKGAWHSGMGGTKPIPYRLHELVNSHPDSAVFICEGEKDADAVAALGCVATCNPFGAGKWKDEYSGCLEGREIFILPDNDEPGRAHADDVKRKLAGVARSVTIVSLPGLPEKGDVSDWLAAGGTLSELFDRAAASSNHEITLGAGAITLAPFAASSTALPLEWVNDIEPQFSGLWLVKKLLPAIGMVLIYGHPGSGKSFLTVDLAFHIALGWDWHGRKVRQGLVIYIGAEGTSGLRNRMAAFRRHHGLDTRTPIPMVLIPTPIDLQAPNSDTPRLIAAIETAERKSGMRAVAIVIDTLSKTFGGGKENTDDMAIYMANCQRVASHFESCVIPVHHRPKDQASEEPRGHSSLKGGVDAVLLVEAGNPRRIRVTKQKDAEPADDMGFTLTQVPLGTDDEGDAVTSCVIAMSEGVPTRTKTGRKLSAGQMIALDALRRALKASGEDAPTEIPLELLKLGRVSRVVKIAAWREQYRAVAQTTDNKPDSYRTAFNRHSEKLQSFGVIQQWEGVVWSTPS